MMEIKHWEVVCKERMNEMPIKTSYVGIASREEVIEFYGLNQPDIEWYNIKEIKEE